MQLYRGFPILTNKIPVEEQEDVPHHLLGQINLDEEPWTVEKYVQKACSMIKKIRLKNRLPIVVGGTHYYTQSLLFEDSTVKPNNDETHSNGPDTDIRNIYPIFNADTPTILDKLREVDPIMADRWHPNDRRKIQRSLEIWYQTGKPASKVYEEQARHRTGISSGDFKDKRENSPGSQLRFPTLLLWVHAATETLRDRLDSRVDKMVQDGLIGEIKSLESYRQTQEAAGESIDRTRGIWQCIGYKQFQDYLDAIKLGKPQKDIDRSKAEAIEQTQAANRQYAKRQLRWIRIKLLHALKHTDADRQLYLLDGTDLDTWHATVRDVATSLTEQFLEGSSDMPHPGDLSTAAREMLQPRREYDMSDRPDLWQRKTCDVCNVISVTESDWNLHVKSKGHRKAVKNSRMQTETNPTLVDLPSLA